ncbi:MAG TPA: peptidylprolyl isomerase [Longimicrobiales bacterium]|nr:peptidylprolyl isomerase [Longimicrobiales bacterium]
MRQMREATKPIIFLAFAAFVALMVFEWGMDITGRSSGGYGEIGRVNGEAVTYDAYMAAYRNLYDQVQRSQEEPISTQQNKEIEDAAFDEVVNQILVRQELERRGISVTNQEIQQAAQYSPPADLRPQFTDSLGGFNVQGYQAFLAQLPQDQLLLLEAYYRDVIPRGKLLRQVSSGIYLSDGALWQQWRDQNEAVEIRYVPLNPGTRYDDAGIPVERGEIEAYYNTHEEEFEMPARATVKAVVLDKTPLAGDTAAALERAGTVRQEILDGADFAAVAQRESSDQVTAAQGGELGVFPKGQMVAAFDSVAFAERIGQLSQPVQTGFGYHLIEVQNRWGADSVQARHILIPIERTDASEIALLTLADSLEDMGLSMTLDEAAAAIGLSATTVDITANFPFLSGAGQIAEGSDWAFEEAAPGDVSPVFENPQAFYALELVRSEPAGVIPLDDAVIAIESQLRFDKKLDRARDEGRQVAERVQAGEALPNVAADMGLEVRNAGPFTRNDFVPGIGRQNAAVGVAFALAPGQVSDAVATPANVFVMELLSKTAADSTAWLDQKEQQRQNAIGMLQQQRLQEWIEALRASATIVDRRDVVLQPADDATGLPPGGGLF